MVTAAEVKTLFPGCAGVADSAIDLTRIADCDALSGDPKKDCIDGQLGNPCTRAAATPTPPTSTYTAPTPVAAPTATVLAAPVSGGTRTEDIFDLVRAGDSLSRIAGRARTTLAEIYRLNPGMTATTTIHPGQQIKVGERVIVLPAPTPAPAPVYSTGLVPPPPPPPKSGNLSWHSGKFLNHIRMSFAGAGYFSPISLSVSDVAITRSTEFSNIQHRAPGGALTNAGGVGFMLEVGIELNDIVMKGLWAFVGYQHEESGLTATNDSLGRPGLDISKSVDLGKLQVGYDFIEDPAIDLSAYAHLLIGGTSYAGTSGTVDTNLTIGESSGIPGAFNIGAGAGARFVYMPAGLGIFTEINALAHIRAGYKVNDMENFPNHPYTVKVHEPTASIAFGVNVYPIQFLRSIWNAFAD